MSSYPIFSREPFPLTATSLRLRKAAAETTPLAMMTSSQALRLVWSRYENKDTPPEGLCNERGYMSPGGYIVGQVFVKDDERFEDWRTWLRTAPKVEGFLEAVISVGIPHHCFVNIPLIEDLEKAVENWRRDVSSAHLANPKNTFRNELRRIERKHHLDANLPPPETLGEKIGDWMNRAADGVARLCGLAR